MQQNCRFAFAIHVLSVLARRPDESFTSEALGHTVNTNPVVIRRLLLDLRRAGLVETQRGPGGGARLARPAHEITLLHLHRAVADGVEPFGAHPNEPAQCCPVGRGIKSVLDEVAARAREAVEREYASITLQTVLQALETPSDGPNSP